MRVLGLSVLIAATIAALQFVAPAVRAQVAEEVAPEAAAPEEGVVIQIGPDRGAGAERRERRRAARRDAAVAVSRYWIGLGGGPLPEELRAQVDVPENAGVLVRTVAPDSPADKAGVQRFDVVLSAGGEPIDSLPRLAEVVGAAGEQGAAIELEVLRRGRRETIALTPVERPIDAAAAPRRAPRPGGLFGPEGLLGGEGLLDAPRSLLEDDALEGFGELIPQMAGAGVSVSVQRQGDGPARVTVRRGGQTWEFNEGDEEAIAKLPDDVRPMIERMLQQNGGAFQPGFEGFGFGGPGFQLQLQGTDGLADRLRAMRERLNEMQRQFGVAPPDAAAPEGPAIELDEAPRFDAAPGSGAAASDAEQVEPGPIEIEIPEAGESE